MMIRRYNYERFKKIFWDLDDTLLDTTQAAYEFHGKPNHYKVNPSLRGKRDPHLHAGMTFNAFWDDLPVEFWAKIPVYKWTKQLIQLSIDKYGVHNVFILTSPIPNAASPAGKQLWVNENFPMLKGQLIISHRKFPLVDNDSILIDDSYQHCNEFYQNNREENFCLFPSYQNELHSMADSFGTNPNLPIEYLKRMKII